MQFVSVHWTFPLAGFVAHCASYRVSAASGLCQLALVPASGMWYVDSEQSWQSQPHASTRRLSLRHEKGKSLVWLVHSQNTFHCFQRVAATIPVAAGVRCASKQAHVEPQMLTVVQIHRGFVLSFTVDLALEDRKLLVQSREAAT